MGYYDPPDDYQPEPDICGKCDEHYPCSCELCAECKEHYDYCECSTCINCGFVEGKCICSNPADPIPDADEGYPGHMIRWEDPDPGYWEALLESAGATR